MSTWMRIQFFTFFFTWATFISYWAPILSDRGFDSSRIGLSITVSLVTRALAVAVLFPLANRRIALGWILRVLPWMSLAAALCFLPHTGFAGLMVISSVFGLLYPTSMPVLETTASLAAQRGALDYGPTRMWGSIGFIVGVGTNAAVASAAGADALMLLFVGGIAAMAVSAHLPLHEPHVAAQRSGSLGSWGPLIRRPIVLLTLVVSVLIQGSHAAYYTFGALHLERLGASSAAIAAMLMLAPIGELIVFRMTGRRADNCSITLLIALAVGGSVLRWMLWAVIPSTTLLIASQLMHGLTFGMLQVGFVQTLRRHVASELVGPAQSLYNAVGTGAGTAVMTLLAGLWFDRSPALAFTAMLVCAVVAVPFTAALWRAERSAVTTAS